MKTAIPGLIGGRGGMPRTRRPASSFLPSRFSLASAATCLATLLLSPLVPGLAAEPSAAGVRQVIIAFKTHFDIGYTEMASNVVQRYRTTMIDDALQVVDQNRFLPPEQRFVWTIPGWPAAKVLEDWPGRLPERQRRIRQAFKEGRFVVHALPFSTHTELLEPEDIVRGLGYSTRLARGLGLELARDAKMTDVPCHSWILPTLLRHAGVDFLHLGCNAASSSPQVPTLFWWEGPDGSRLLTMYSATGYGTGLAPPADWPYQTWLALIHTGDNHGPPRPEEVAKVLAEGKQMLPGVKVRIGRLSDFADAILAETAPIPVVRGDMPDTWIHGPMCDPAGARLARNLRPLLGVAEGLDTQLAAWGIGLPGSPAPVLAAAREQSLLYSEHTWGGALYWIVEQYSQHSGYWYGQAWKEQRAAGRFNKIEASWAEHSAYIEKARDLAQPVLDQELSLLARSVKVPGERVVVFNPLPWKRDGLVRLRGVAPRAGVKPVGGRETAPAWTQDGALCFVARGLPPSGYRTYQFVPASARPSAVRADEAARSLESPSFKAVLDSARGAIVSLVDNRSGRELVDSAAAHGFGQLLYERFDADTVAAYVKAYVKIGADWAVTELGKPSLPPSSEVPYRAASPTEGTLSFERSPGAVAAVMRFPPSTALPFAVTTRLTLYADLACADLEITVHDKPADSWPEAGWICLPFKVDAPQFRLGRLGAIEDPTRDFVPGANHDLGAIHTGVALFDAQGRGVGLCPLDSPIVSLERPGCFKYSPDFLPRKPSVFINLFNNQWSTNFRLWNSGTWTSRVRLWSFSRFDNTTGLAAPSLEARQPLLAALADGAPGRLPPAQRGLALSRPGVAVTAFCPDPDGEGTLLRLWEYGGSSGKCQVRLPKGLNAANAQPVDLRGQPAGQSTPVHAGAFTVRLGAFAPASFRLSAGEKEKGQ